MFEVGTVVCKKRGKYKDIPGIIVHRSCSIYNNKPCFELIVNLFETGTILSGRHYGFKPYNTRSITDYTNDALKDVHTVLESGLDLVNRWAKEEVVTKFTEPREVVGLENKRMEYKPKALYDLLEDYEDFISEDGFASNDEKEWFLKNWLIKLTEDNKQELIDFVKGEINGTTHN